MKNKTRLNDIANAAMSAWIRQEIFHYSEPPAVKDCDSSVECTVSTHINSKRDYVNMLYLAANFRSFDDYQLAIKVRQQLQEMERPLTQQRLQEVAITRTSKDFSDTVGTLVRPFVLINETYELMDLAYVYACLSGEENSPRYEPRPTSGDLIGGKLMAVFSTMKDLGLWQEWNALMEGHPQPAIANRNSILKQFQIA